MELSVQWSDNYTFYVYTMELSVQWSDNFTFYVYTMELFVQWLDNYTFYVYTMELSVEWSDTTHSMCILQGIKEVTILGQNVNSYRDLSELKHIENPEKTPTRMAKGV